LRGTVAAVTRWIDVAEAEPDFAEQVRARFEVGQHKTIATLRADGAPRISGIECEFVEGDLRFGSMLGARKGADLRRDPRFALHSPSVHPVEGEEAAWPGEAKIAGRAVLAGTLGGDAHGQTAGDASDGSAGGADEPEGEAFVADISEVVLTALNDDATELMVRWWTPTDGLRTVTRE
jgi:hypothetical protein